MLQARSTKVFVTCVVSGMLLWQTPGMAQAPPAPQAAAISPMPPEDRALAERKFEQGKKDFDAERYESALTSFQAALALFPSNGSRFKIASTEEKLGRVASAWKHFCQLALELPNDDPRKTESARRAEDLERRLPKLRLLAIGQMPRDTKILFVNNTTGVSEVFHAAQLPTEWARDPGTYVVHTMAPGFQNGTYHAIVKEGSDTAVYLSPLRPLNPAASPAPAGEGQDLSAASALPTLATAPSASATSTPQDARPPRSSAMVAYFAFGVAGASVLIGGVLGGAALATKSGGEDTLSSSKTESFDGDSKGHAAETAFGMAGVFAATGGVILLTRFLSSERDSAPAVPATRAPSKKAGSAIRTSSIVPLVHSQGGGVVANFHF